MKGARGVLRVVGQPDEQGYVEVYYRPPPAYFEGLTLLSVLTHRLGDHLTKVNDGAPKNIRATASVHDHSTLKTP
ncbi:MAG TPA: hypothetical protein VG711_12705, partial [Phycisphaerales bacterium]|nr:hypothetical protein [Phycisphaerales bacterium]